MDRLDPTQHGCHDLHGDPRRVVERLLGHEDVSARVNVNARVHALRLGASRVPGDLGPHLPEGPKLGDLLEEIALHTHLEAETTHEGIRLQPALLARIDHRFAPGQTVRQLLYRRRPCLGDAVHEDVRGVPGRNVLRAILDQVHHQGIAVFRFPARNVLHGRPGIPVHRVSAQRVRRLAPPLRRGHDVGQTGQAILAGDQGEIGRLQLPSPDDLVVVVGRRQVHPALPNVSLRFRMVRIDPVHGRDVVDHVEHLVAEVSLHPLLDQGLHLGARLFAGSEPENHLLHPGREGIPIRVKPAGKRIDPRHRVQIQILHVFLGVDCLDRDPGQVGCRLEAGRVPLPRLLPGLFRPPEVFAPLFFCH